MLYIENIALLGKLQSQSLDFKKYSNAIYFIQSVNSHHELDACD